MMKYRLIIFMVVVFLGVLACKKQHNEPSFKGANELKVDFENGQNVLSLSNLAHKIRLRFLLAKSEDSDVVFPITITSSDEAVNVRETLVLSAPELKISKGNQEGFVEFSVNPSAKMKSGDILTFIVKIGDVKGTNITNKNEGLKVVLKSTPIFEGLSDKQQAQLNKSKVGIATWIGELEATVEIDQPAGGYFSFANEKRLRFNTTSVITIAENVDNPATLQMTYNAFGLNDYFYEVLRKNTIEISCEGLNDEKCTGFNYDLIKKARWKREDIESLNVKHPKLVFVPDADDSKKGNILFTVNEGNETKLPYQFEFSVWEKIKKRATEGDADAKELVEGDLLNPDDILNGYDISVDEDGKALVTMGRYDETTGELKFVFYSNSSNGADEMTKITAIYKGKKR